MKKTLMVAAALTALAGGSARADWMTYRNWAELPQDARALYIAGSVDGILSTMSNRERAQKVADCLHKVAATPLTLSEAVLAYSKDKPQFHVMAGVQYLLTDYLSAACGV